MAGEQKTDARASQRPSTLAPKRRAAVVSFEGKSLTLEQVFGKNPIGAVAAMKKLTDLIEELSEQQGKHTKAGDDR